MRAGEEVARVVTQLPVIAHQHRVRQAAAGIAALADQAEGDGRHADIQQDRLTLGRDTGSNRVGGVHRVDAAMSTDQPHRRIRRVDHGQQPLVGVWLEVGGQAADMGSAAYYRNTDALLGRARGRAIQCPADAIGPQHVVAVEQAGNTTVGDLLQCLRAGLDLPAEHAVDVAADQVEAMGTVAEQFAFEQHPGHHLGDLHVGSGFHEQLLDKRGKRLHVVPCGLNHCSCLANGTGAVNQVTAPICHGTNSFCP
ncbi:hypothetical protein D9M71_479590 [compost metagenome]